MLVILLKHSLSALSPLSLISNCLVIVFDNNTIRILLFARLDIRSNSAPKRPLIVMKPDDTVKG